MQGLAALYRDNVWKLHRLPESIILDRGLQFAAQMTKELNTMLQHGTDSYIMITWYVGQARLFSFQPT